ncbi:hypothetical protein HBH98_064200 [Parastagonospora nodorum]|nr:hypothetical protein HBI09_164030 [Parastagonospora nodorum]KAH4045796.1 hypothetical protein HBH49_195610 [Parastagonospora nodorum]KAH4264316.1 hypothetical protein HBI03_088590 [Parastagonospora nodorum]KAH4278671.1 hypothetical protein HBI04_083760 [Parastagonospora nodorum]KAH4349233.1 hypothetical protein HBH98_064200 [Parastagonospora nodorum]
MSPSDMADAPQVVPRTDYPETSWKYETAVPEYHDKSAPTYAQTTDMEDEAPKKDTRIVGLRRRTFWIIVVVAIVVIGGGVVGASVGGTLAVKRSGNKSDQSAEPLEALPSSASSPSSSPVQSVSASPISSSATQSAIVTSASSTVRAVAYAPLDFTQVNTINIECPPNVYVSGQEWGKKYRYNCEKRRSVGLGGIDVSSFTAYTFQQCVDACSQWNEMTTKTTPCKAVVIASDLMGRRSAGNGANCWLKSSSDSDDKEMPLMNSFTLIQ